MASEPTRNPGRAPVKVAVQRRSHPVPGPLPRPLRFREPVLRGDVPCRVHGREIDDCRLHRQGQGPHGTPCQAVQALLVGRRLPARKDSVGRWEVQPGVAPVGAAATGRVVGELTAPKRAARTGRGVAEPSEAVDGPVIADVRLVTAIVLDDGQTLHHPGLRRRRGEHEAGGNAYQPRIVPRPQPNRSSRSRRTASGRMSATAPRTALWPPMRPRVRRRIGPRDVQVDGVMQGIGNRRPHQRVGNQRPER